MFNLNPSPTFKADVQLTLPGGIEQASIALVFKHLGKKALEAWVRGAASVADDAAFLGEVVESWSGVMGVDGKPVAYTSHKLADLLDNYPASGREIYDAYLAALTEGRIKN